MSGLKFDASSLLKGLSNLDDSVERESIIYANTSANKMVNHAKEKAPWIDRTGNSRQTIDSTIEKEKDSIVINLRGNTPHFKYLELCHEKKNAILWPTIQKYAVEVLRGWSKVIRK